jgi:hypothetical protein
MSPNLPMTENQDTNPRQRSSMQQFQAGDKGAGGAVNG